MEPILIGTTDRTILVFIPDPASTDGSGKTGLAHTDMTVSYTRVETDNDVVVTDVTSSLNALTNLTDSHNDWGWKEVSSSLAPGLYRLDVADALFASGAWYAVLYVEITSSAAAATPKAFMLVGYNPLDGVRLGLTALPNAAAAASGGLIINGSNSGTVTLDALTVSGATTLTGNVALAAGMTITQSSSNSPGVSITGNGTGAGVLTTGGATGHGWHSKGGATSGDGGRFEAQNGNSSGLQGLGVGSGHGGRFESQGTTGSGIHTRGGSGGDGWSSQGYGTGGGATFHGGADKGSGAGNGPGLYACGDGTGAGGQFSNFTGGKGILVNSTDEIGFAIISTGTNATAAYWKGDDTGSAFVLEGGDTGNGLDIIGGQYIGSGHAIRLQGFGTGKCAIKAETTGDYGIESNGAVAGALLRGINAGLYLQSADVTGGWGALYLEVLDGDDTGAAFAAYRDSGTSLGMSESLAAAPWDLATTGHTTSGTFGAAMNAAGAAGDPWSTSLPGAYSSGSAGYLIGTYVNASISAVKAKTDNLPSDPADASDISSAFSTVNSTLSTIAGYLDTEIAAIKAKTDNLPSDPADASDIAASFSTVNSTLSTIAGYIDTEVATIVTQTSAASIRSALGLASANLDTQLDALPTAAENATALMDLSNGIETGVTPRQALRLILAAEAGKLSGAATTTITIRNVGDSKDRIVATVDADGNRSALTLDAT